MRNLLKIVVLFLTSLLFTSCSSPYRQVKINEIIENKYVLYKVPNDYKNWEIVSEYDRNIWKYKSAAPALYHIRSNMELAIWEKKYDLINVPLFERNGEYLDSNVKEIVLTKEDRATNITYAKQWISYVHHMRCSEGVFSRGFGGEYYSGGLKMYGITCGFYDKTKKGEDSKRELVVSYNYSHNTKNNIGKKTEAEIKRTVKEVLSTLIIKNIDLERMKKENLLHYDKEYKISKW